MKAKINYPVNSLEIKIKCPQFYCLFNKTQYTMQQVCQ